MQQIEQYRTIFGFYTSNKVACKAIDYVYWVVIAVAYIFAFHALNQILSSWNFLLIAIASLAVVGLPYCVKIIMFGREEFDVRVALLCGFLSLLPTIFDFAGFYSETALNDELKKGKISLVDSINQLEKVYKLNVEQQKEKINVETEKLKKLSSKQINDANQKIIDEKTGVRADYLTGKVGDGPRTKELQSEARRLQSDLQIEIESAEKLKAEKLAALQENIDKFDAEVLTLKNSLNDTKSFKDVEKEMLKINGFFSSYFSKINYDFKAITPKLSDNIITLSFNALFRLDITALVCLLMAVLMEIGDIVITFVTRHKKKVKEKKVEAPATIHKPLLFKKSYHGY